jgi:hypothetical protein
MGAKGRVAFHSRWFFFGFLFGFLVLLDAHPILFGSPPPPPPSLPPLAPVARASLSCLVRTNERSRACVYVVRVVRVLNVFCACEYACRRCESDPRS